MSGEVKKADLLGVERVYDEIGLQPEIDICQYAHASAFKLLEHEYNVTGSICAFQRSLSGGGSMADTATPADGVEVAETRDVEQFVNASIEGFRSGGRSTELLGLLAKAAAQRNDTTLFVAKVNGEVAGTASVAYVDASGTKFANLYIDSTLPRFREKGVHRALIAARLAAAARNGCEVAIASARSDSISARSIEKAGFERVFSSSTYTRVATRRRHAAV